MKNNNSKTLFILSLLFLAGSSSVFFFILKEINNNDLLAEQYTKDLQIETNRREKVKSLDSLIKDTKYDRSMIENHFVQGGDVVSFLDKIESLALKVSVDAKIMSVDLLDDNNSMVVQIKASGNFQMVYKFLELLENAPYQLEFLSMNMQKGILSDELAKVKKTGWEVNFKIKILSFIK